MLFNHEVTKRNEKIAARKVQEQAMRELKESKVKRAAA
jgi:GDP-D-mannose dehydratase